MKNNMKAMAWALAWLCLFSGSAAAQIGHDKKTTVLMKTLGRLSQKGYLFGHQDDLVYGHSWNNQPGRSDVRDVCGDYPAVVGFDLGRIEYGKKENLDGVDFDSMRNAAIAHYRRGGMVVFSWHANNPATDEDAWHVGDGTVVKSVLPGGANHEKMIHWIDCVADFLLSLEVDGKPMPVLFRPWHEQTGSWFWWGQDLCSADDYIALWRMTADRLAECGLHNLIYVYSPGGDDKADSSRYLQRYPGDGYADMLGFDCYMYGGEKGAAAYTAQVSGMLSMISDVGRRHRKLIALTETGCESVPVADWWTRVLMPAIGDARISYVLVWRNAHDKPTHYYAPFPGEASAADFVSFCHKERTLFLNDVKLHKKKIHVRIH